jgi:MFS family permease
MAVYMVGQIAGPLVAGRVGDDVARVSWTAAAAAGIGVLMVLVGASAGVWMVFPLFLALGLAGGALNALIGTLVVMRPADQVRGRVLATLNGTARGFSVIALVLGGLGGQLLGARTTFVTCGLLSVLVSLVVLRSRSAAETGPVEPVREPATMGA